MSTLEINSNIQIPLSELVLTFSRSGGPGGQNVNKVNSKVTLSWDIKNTKTLPTSVQERFTRQNSTRITNEGLFVIQSEKFRDQKRNIQDCYDKLKDIVIKATYKPKPRIATKPTKGSVDKRIKEKKSRGDTKKNRSKVDY